MAFAAIGALIAGAEVTAPLVLGSIAEVGTAMTVVGAITGSKDLMKVGGVMGLVGGVGGFVAGGMGAGADAAAAGGADASAGGSDVLSSGIDSSPSAASSTIGDPTGAAMNPTDMRLAAGTQAAPASAADLSGVGDSLSTGTDTSAMGMGSDPTTAATMTGTDTTTSATGDTSGLGTSTDTGSAATSNGTTGTSSTVGDQTAASQPVSGAPAVSTPDGTVAPPSAATPASAGVPPNPTISVPPNPLLAQSQAGAAMGNPMDSTSYLQKIMAYAQDPKNRTVLDLGAKLVGGAFQGMQQQKQWAQLMDYRNRALAQTSYGSQVGQNRPRGIIGGARA